MGEETTAVRATADATPSSFGCLPASGMPFRSFFTHALLRFKCARGLGYRPPLGICLNPLFPLPVHLPVPRLAEIRRRGAHSHAAAL